MSQDQDFTSLSIILTPEEFARTTTYRREYARAHDRMSCGDTPDEREQVRRSEEAHATAISHLSLKPRSRS